MSYGDDSGTADADENLLQHLPRGEGDDALPAEGMHALPLSHRAWRVSVDAHRPAPMTRRCLTIASLLAGTKREIVVGNDVFGLLRNGALPSDIPTQGAFSFQLAAVHGPGLAGARVVAVTPIALRRCACTPSGCASCRAIPASRF